MRGLAFAAGLLLAVPAPGHHSDAALDLSRTVTVEGVVTEFAWRNPHVYFGVETTGDSGEPVEWSVQMGSTITVTRMGWSRDTLSIGDPVAVAVHPARDGRPYGLFNAMETEAGGDSGAAYDRSSGELRFETPQVTAGTTTLDGRWLADASQLEGSLGGIDNLTNAMLTLTPAGEAARAAYDENSEENPELRCIGRPTPAMILYTNLYPMEFDFAESGEAITIRSQFFDEERTVHVDGRPHPDPSVRFHEGHSIGWWEDDVLVVDTTNFADHRSPYQNGIPSGAQKHVVERYRLADNGTRLIAEFLLEDPEYIVGSMTHTRELIYSPQAGMEPFSCDPESTRRFLPE